MPALLLENVQKSYPLPSGGHHLVLDVPKFSLEPGEQLALEGPSGTGKTTLLHCCAGILRPDRGRVVLDGQDLGALPESKRDALRGRRLGYVFQSFNLLQGLSAQENVALALGLGGETDPDRALALLKRVGLAAKAGHRPSQLSAGQQQRVAVARALARRPCVVLADEPTGNLDAAASREALALLREACKEAGAALLLVSHDPGVLRQFKRREHLAKLNRAGAKPKAARRGRA
ncbi:MAG TPA: ABC transporter ATP-binding protein [bacterium]|nr:ABC transporter ATP-binding protein [bacterium]